MLEAQAHDRLKQLLRDAAGSPWPHHLTLTRLVARSLRRQDHSLFPLCSAGDRPWLLSLLVPLTLSDQPVALLSSQALRQRLLRQEWPQLTAAGLGRPLWQGTTTPPARGSGFWIRRNWCRSGGPVSWGTTNWSAPKPRNWSRCCGSPEPEAQSPGLGRPGPGAAGPGGASAHPPRAPEPPSAEPPLGRDQRLAIAPEDEAPLRLLLRDQQPLPVPWQAWLDSGGDDWTGWAVVDPRLLQWSWERQPLRPLRSLGGLLQGRGTILAGNWLPERRRLDDLGLHHPVVVPLGMRRVETPCRCTCHPASPCPTIPAIRSICWPRHGA